MTADPAAALAESADGPPVTDPPDPPRPSRPHGPPGPTTPDDATLAAAAAGHEWAFERLYLDLQPRLRRYAISLVGQDADDVTAEAWLQIARDLPRFTRDLDGFRGWCARIVRNRALDHLRARSRRPSDSLDDLFAAQLPARDDTESAALDLLSTEAAVAFIADLPRTQAEIVLLRAVVGLDVASTADVVGKSATAVRVACHRGLRTLARRLAERDGPR